MAGLLFVVAREERRLYDNLVECFAGRPGVRVVMDRREKERRSGNGSAPLDRRQRDRRIRPHTAAELTTEGWTVVRVNRPRA